MIINNVKLVLEDEVVQGSLEIAGGVIRAFAETQSRLPEALDGEGGWLLPGLIELHTDNLDKFFTPRPKVDWPAHSAMSSHDALMVASGITTVLDAVAIGDVRDGGDRLARYEEEQLALAARWSQPNRNAIAQLCRERNIALASHDDATSEHVLESHQLGSVIAEFPTTFAAAEASRQHGMNVLMGAPNIVRGGSHSGNVAAHKLAELGLLDILSSDYYPASLLDAAFRVADDDANRFTLPQAIRLVTRNPARALNLDDRGVVAEGKRADLVLAHRKGGNIHIDHVWRQGKRVF